MPKEFQNSVFSCFSDYRLCLLTFCVPCYTQGKNAEAVGEDCLLVGLLSAVGLGFGPVVRWRLRQERGLNGSMLTDVLLHMVLPCCSLIQEAQEIGWGLPEGVVKAGDKVDKAMKKEEEPTQEMNRE